MTTLFLCLMLLLLIFATIWCKHALSPLSTSRCLPEMQCPLDMHINILQDFKFVDSQYELALHSQVYVIACQIPAEHQCPLWKKWYLIDDEALCHDYLLDDEVLLSSKEGYETNGEGCVAEANIWPFHVVILLPPCHPTATPSPKKSLWHSPKRPKPYMVGSPEPPKELAFSAPGKKFLSILLPLAGSALGGPNTHKQQCKQVAITETLVPVSNIWSKPVGVPSSSVKPIVRKAGPKNKVGPKKKAVPGNLPVPVPITDPVQMGSKPSPSSESEVPESKDNGEVPVKAKEPLFLLSDTDPIGDEDMPPPAKCVGVESSVPKDSAPSPPYNTIYAQAFHPDINLRFHKPPSCLLANSGTVTSTFIAAILTLIPTSYAHLPYLNLLYFNCMLASIPDECVFEGKIGEEWCTKCKTNRHGPCSARWNTNQLCNMASLLDQLTLSGDSVIAWGLVWVKGINT
ncbi:hypothetical protein EDD18DRAFT_1109232 [Armillaria luteobubalina]|uniref:Uncharacterized protein n=1 Tax=Armillaria luteobubalina TaxID=153913 RepID=A0AA39PX07_9AGAR|nr:hypothetical protein EDD18DRAFT_1109232 [Armillaria luteobubalina]